MNYKKLFDHVRKEHNILLLESEMQEICNIVNDIQKAASGSFDADELKYRCGHCAQELTLVRPGKHQCDNPNCLTNNTNS